MAGETGLAHILRARNFIQSNKFDEEGFLEKCNRHFSPATTPLVDMQVPDS
ncbi:hypothetical protein KC960_00030 [Candidatus Saccharibacteria bacterium]|nr:hypothetical protein [Candidatus Saccharibacteria bacterium]